MRFERQDPKSRPILVYLPSTNDQKPIMVSFWFSDSFEDVSTTTSQKSRSSAENKQMALYYHFIKIIKRGLELVFYFQNRA